MVFDELWEKSYFFPSNCVMELQDILKREGGIGLAEQGVSRPAVDRAGKVPRIRVLQENLPVPCPHPALPLSHPDTAGGFPRFQPPAGPMFYPADKRG